ncbi:TRAP transporter small permease [Oscillibacter sp.]|uniref:TRAP transporter small permease n=1 Tax=Oscillibacter sp. TaxID=1945593 RepID=UPI002610FD1A|nr:TRAP transporter small permease subunit [Oscillibacter sp.]MDD3347218.1 TRAP transporter small permease subunit [Oscillibacter sp.]
MRKFCDFIEKFYKFFFYLSGVFLFIMFFVCAYSVITRLFGAPSIWADELIRFLMVFMAFTGAPWLINTKGDLVVDLSEIFFSKKKKLLHANHLIGDVITLAILVYLIFPTYSMSMKNMTSMTSAMQWTLGYVYLCMPVSFGFCAIAQIKNIVKFHILPKKEEGVSVKGEA